MHNYYNSNANVSFIDQSGSREYASTVTVTLENLDTIHGTRKQTGPFELCLRPPFPDVTRVTGEWKGRGEQRTNGEPVRRNEERSDHSRQPVSLSGKIFFHVCTREYSDTTIRIQCGTLQRLQKCY